MSPALRYGKVALGVESALPAAIGARARRTPARRLLGWLMAALKRWA